jgi:hypothetical protein
LAAGAGAPMSMASSARAMDRRSSQGKTGRERKQSTFLVRAAILDTSPHTRAGRWLFKVTEAWIDFNLHQKF